MNLGSPWESIWKILILSIILGRELRFAKCINISRSIRINFTYFPTIVEITYTTSNVYAMSTLQLDKQTHA